MTDQPPPYRSTNRADMPADAVKMTGGGEEHWYRRGVCELMMALIEFEPHPLDLRQSNARFEEAVRETARYSDTVLSVVAAQLHERRRERKLKYRPRLAQLHEMCRAATPAAEFDAELAAIFTPRRRAR